MIRLPNTGTYSLELITAQNGAQSVVSYSDATSSAYTGGTQVASITSATTTTICSTPAASTVRDVDQINIKNTFAGSHTVTVQIDANGTNYPLIVAALLTDESLNYTHGSGWQVKDANGSTKQAQIIGMMTSAQLAAAITDETGSGLLVFGTSPTIATPTLTGTVTATGLVDISGASAGQIKFPATENTSADPNTLTDYEIGTWTPVLTAQTPGDVSVSYTQQVGLYTKVGRSVDLAWSILTSSFTRTTASGGALITGAPFAASASIVAFHGPLAWGGITKAGYTQIVARLGAIASTTFDLLASGSGVAVAQALITDMPSGGTVNLRGATTYNV
jgi:hypothetical protein